MFLNYDFLSISYPFDHVKQSGLWFKISMPLCTPVKSPNEKP